MKEPSLYRNSPGGALFCGPSSKALARPFGSRMLWELDRGQHFLPKPVCKQFRLRTQQPAPAGVSQACTPRAQAGLRFLTPAPGQGTTPPTTAHPTHSRVVTSRLVPVHPIYSRTQGMCGGPGPVLSLRGYNTRRRAAQFSRTVRAKPERLEIAAAYGGRACFPGSECAIPPQTAHPT